MVDREKVFTKNPSAVAGCLCTTYREVGEDEVGIASNLFDEGNVGEQMNDTQQGSGSAMIITWVAIGVCCLAVIFTVIAWFKRILCFKNCGPGEGPETVSQPQEEAKETAIPPPIATAMMKAAERRVSESSHAKHHKKGTHHHEHHAHKEHNETRHEHDHHDHKKHSHQLLEDAMEHAKGGMKKYRRKKRKKGKRTKKRGLQGKKHKAHGHAPQLSELTGHHKAHGHHHDHHHHSHKHHGHDAHKAEHFLRRNSHHHHQDGEISF